MTRKILALAAALSAGASLSAFLPASAQAQGAWCAEQGGRSGYRNCGYYTYGQCRAAVSGVGGFCYANPEGGGGGYGGRGYVYGVDYGFGYDVPPPAPRYRRY